MKIIDRYEKPEKPEDIVYTITHKVTDIEKINPGDVIVYKRVNDRINFRYVDDVVLKPMPPYLHPPVPYIRLLRTSLEVCVRNEQITSRSLCIPSPGTYCRSTLEIEQDNTFELYVKWFGWDANDEMKEVVRREIRVVHDSRILELASVIPMMETPSLNFLVQTLDGDDSELIQCVKNSKEDFEQLYKLNDRIEKRFRNVRWRD